MISVSKFGIAAGFVFVWCVAAAAHHSGAAYDMEHQKTFEGTVKTVNWTNPHITFHVVTDGKNGQPDEEWVLEVSSPGVLTRSGWTKRSLQPGDHATFKYAPLRDGSHAGFLRQVTLQNGSTLSFSFEPNEQ